MERNVEPDTIVYKDMTFGEVMAAARAAGELVTAYPDLDVDDVLSFHQRTCAELMAATMKKV